MAIESQSPPRPIGADAGPVIENELPAYRALSRMAIASLVFGIGSILTFTSPYFVPLGVLAVVSGMMAQRSIRKLPDVLTGERMANVGVALALLFTLTAPDHRGRPGVDHRARGGPVHAELPRCLAVGEG